MKSVLISIQPKWCELIASGKKTIEVRKSRPKIDTPFKCYIYCTIGNGVKGDYLVPSNIQCGKVIGEFVCDEIDKYLCEEYGWGDGSVSLEYRIRTVEGEKTCLEYDEIREYGNEKPLYFWNISDLKIYDKPKELGEFKTIKLIERSIGFNRYEKKAITRPPKSWCYVESLGE